MYCWRTLTRLLFLSGTVCKGVFPMDPSTRRTQTVQGTSTRTGSGASARFAEDIVLTNFRPLINHSCKKRRNKHRPIFWPKKTAPKLRGLQHFQIRDKTAYMPLKLVIFIHSVYFSPHFCLIIPITHCNLLLIIFLITLIPPVLVAPVLLAMCYKQQC